MLRSALAIPLLILSAGSALTGQELPVGTPRDSAVARAELLINAGRYWEATRVLDPLLGVPPRRTPEVVLLAARAAAGWQGWTRVEALLGTAPWLDLDFGGGGRELLARAALARHRDSVAAIQAHAALRAAGTDSVRHVRLILAARAMERRAEYDSAAALYRAAREGFPTIRDWVTLRAAGATLDSAARRALLDELKASAARDRGPWTDALGFTRAKQPRSAARVYGNLGEPVMALGQRLEAADTPVERTRVRSALVDALRASGPSRLTSSQVGAAVALLDRAFSPLDPTEELIIAGRATDGDRAAVAYAAAARGGLLTQSDRFAWATLLVRLGREAQAIAQFDRVTDPGLRGQATYQRARALLRSGLASAAATALSRIPTDFRTDVDAASSALYLSGDLRTDANDDSTARVLFRRIAQNYPGSRFADRARFRAAFIALVRNDPATAAEEFDQLARDKPSGEEASASLYWGGRAHMLLGDTVGARERLGRLAVRRDGAYYVTLAAGILRLPAWVPEPGSTVITIPDEVRAALARVRLLGELGLRTEIEFELDRLDRDASGSLDRLLGTAQALADAGESSRAMRLAQRALTRGAPRTESLYRLLYPFPEENVLLHEAERQGLDPFLVAGLIRQESAFDPTARSAADARGLMQILPRLGEDLAREAGIVPWDEVLLYQPAISITFGVKHLADIGRTYGAPEHLLAAYNAGAHRVVRWNDKRGATEDPALFVERIPYVETRDYVRRVLANRTVYQQLYGTAGAVAPASVP